MTDINIQNIIEEEYGIISVNEEEEMNNEEVVEDVDGIELGRLYKNENIVKKQK